MEERYEEFRKMELKKLIEKFDIVAKDYEAPPEFFLNEIARRELVRLTRWIAGMTLVMMVFTIILVCRS